MREWAKENNEDEEVPTEYDDVHTPETMKIKPQISIISPKNLATVSAPYVGVWAKAESKAGIDHIEYYWDGELQYTATTAPYKGTLEISKRLKKGSEHTIEAVVFDSLYRTNRSSIKVKIGDDKVNPMIEFAYPGDGVRLPVGTSMTTMVNAFDPNGDILKVEFYMDGELEHVVRQPPYLWQFMVPSDLGEHTIRAIAYDHAKNSAKAEIKIISKESDTISGGNSRILDPYKNESFDEGERILIKAYLNEEARDDLKELIILARQKDRKTIEVAKVPGDPETGGAYIYTFIWDSASVGVYDLQLKIILQDGKMRFSERIPIVVR